MIQGNSWVCRAGYERDGEGCVAITMAARVLCVEMNGSAAPDIAVSRINVLLLSPAHGYVQGMDGNAIQDTAGRG